MTLGVAMLRVAVFVVLVGVAAAAEDLLVLNTGHRLDCTVISVSDDQVVVEISGIQAVYERRRVLRVEWNSKPRPAPMPAPVAAQPPRRAFDPQGWPTFTLGLGLATGATGGTAEITGEILDLVGGVETAQAESVSMSGRAQHPGLRVDALWFHHPADWTPVFGLIISEDALSGEDSDLRMISVALQGGSAVKAGPVVLIGLLNLGVVQGDLDSQIRVSNGVNSDLVEDTIPLLGWSVGLEGRMLYPLSYGYLGLSLGLGRASLHGSSTWVSDNGQFSGSEEATATSTSVMLAGAFNFAW